MDALQRYRGGSGSISSAFDLPEQGQHFYPIQLSLASANLLAEGGKKTLTFFSFYGKKNAQEELLRTLLCAYHMSSSEHSRHPYVRHES